MSLAMQCHQLSRIARQLVRVGLKPLWLEALLIKRDVYCTLGQMWVSDLQRGARPFGTMQN